ncbi:MAG: hypothetical protein UU47_C0002G0015 [candidate division TM6 bacterium GW2011_GWE2_41_16]|nr:MAG: hypothetical protein UU47_C0002G0015 [candidate division TM6 bacterium GW2011_GWE2_41_16]
MLKFGSAGELLLGIFVFIIYLIVLVAATYGFFHLNKVVDKARKAADISRLKYFFLQTAYFSSYVVYLLFATLIVLSGSFFIGYMFFFISKLFINFLYVIHLV